ncbi:hypothetical protein ESCO47_00135 [Escherichia phage vB_EcoM_ESCO47]|nr:hypothetical protein ESCO47_00135 [Escherichia phage vB_EcoM_ESCO47]
MFKWFKELFASTPGQGMVPIDTHAPKKEYIYAGDGMMEEVVCPAEKADNVGQVASSLNASELKSQLEKLKEERSQRQTYIDAAAITTVASVSSWSGDSCSSSSDCSSSSGSCD